MRSRTMCCVSSRCECSSGVIFGSFAWQDNVGDVTEAARARAGPLAVKVTTCYLATSARMWRAEPIYLSSRARGFHFALLRFAPRDAVAEETCRLVVTSLFFRRPLRNLPLLPHHLPPARGESR